MVDTRTFELLLNGSSRFWSRLVGMYPRFAARLVTSIVDRIRARGRIRTWYPRYTPTDSGLGGIRPLVGQAIAILDARPVILPFQGRILDLDDLPSRWCVGDRRLACDGLSVQGTEPWIGAYG